MSKTVVQQLVEYFEQQLRLQDDPMFIESGREAYQDAIEVCNNVLTKEKEQIKDAFVAGSERGTKDIPFNCEQYYSQTYNSQP